MGDITLKLTEEDIKKSIRVMLTESGMDSMAALGEQLGYKQTTFRSAVSNNSIRLKDFIKAAEIMDFEVIVRKKQ